MHLFPFLCLVLSCTVAVSHALFTPSVKHGCQVFEKAGLINLDVLGCGSVLSHEKRYEPAHPTADKTKLCEAMKAAGLTNLNVVGCPGKTSLPLPPAIEVRDWDEAEAEADLIENPPKGVFGGAGGHGGRDTEGHEQPLLAARCKTWPHCGAHPPSVPPSNPPPATQPPHVPTEPQPTHDNPPAGSGGQTPPPPPPSQPPSSSCGKPCSNEKLCEVFQHGLINVDILGCASILSNGGGSGAGGGGGWGGDGGAPMHCGRGIDGGVDKRCNTAACGGDYGQTKCTHQACEILQQAGLLNLDILGCAHVL